MTTPRLTRKEKQEQTRAAVLRAAAELFAASGVEGTSLEAIARHAGVTQGAIYSNFASKSDLWWAIATQMSRTPAFEVHFQGEHALREELTKVGSAVWHILQSTSRTQLLLAQEFDLFLMRHPRERARYTRGTRAALSELADRLEKGAVRRGEPLPIPAPQLAHAIQAVAEGVLHLFMLDPRAIDEELCVAVFTALASR